VNLVAKRTVYVLFHADNAYVDCIKEKCAYQDGSSPHPKPEACSDCTEYILTPRPEYDALERDAKVGRDVAEWAQGRFTVPALMPIHEMVTALTELKEVITKAKEAQS
jgi:hypothetical protein